MLPQVKNGDYVVLFTCFNGVLKIEDFIIPESSIKSSILRPGMQVVFNHPDYGVLLKSVKGINRRKKTFSAKGYNRQSIKAEVLKNMPTACIKGLVIWQFSSRQD